MDTKAALTAELRILLTCWELLLEKQNALEDEYSTLRNRITAICNKLDALEAVR